MKNKTTGWRGSEKLFYPEGTELSPYPTCSDGGLILVSCVQRDLLEESRGARQFPADDRGSIGRLADANPELFTHGIATKNFKANRSLNDVLVVLTTYLTDAIDTSDFHASDSPRVQAQDLWGFEYCGKALQSHDSADSSADGMTESAEDVAPIDFAVDDDMNSFCCVDFDQPSPG